MQDFLQALSGYFRVVLVCIHPVSAMSRGRPKAKLRDYSRITLTLEQSSKLRETLLAKEHSITVAILGAVMVEHELDFLLRRRFKKQTDEMWEGLVSDHGPLSSFHSKIIAGFAFSIYDKKTRDDLGIVRVIRNAFAHSKKLIDFDDVLILPELLKASCLQKGFKQTLQAATENREMARACYISICQSLTIKLLNRKIRAGQASARYFKRKYPSPFANALAAYGTTSNLPVSLSGLGSFLRPSRGDQTANPIREALQSKLDELTRKPTTIHDNKDK